MGAQCFSERDALTEQESFRFSAGTAGWSPMDGVTQGFKQDDHSPFCSESVSLEADIVVLNFMEGFSVIQLGHNQNAPKADEMNLKTK